MSPIYHDTALVTADSSADADSARAARGAARLALRTAPAHNYATLRASDATNA